MSFRFLRKAFEDSRREVSACTVQILATGVRRLNQEYVTCLKFEVSA